MQHNCFTLLASKMKPPRCLAVVSLTLMADCTGAPTLMRHGVTLEVDSLFSHRFQHFEYFDISMDAAVGSHASSCELTSLLLFSHPAAAIDLFMLQWKKGAGFLGECSVCKFSLPLDHEYDPFSRCRHCPHSRTSGAMETPKEPARHHSCSLLGCSAGNLLALSVPLRLGDLCARGG